MSALSVPLLDTIYAQAMRTRRAWCEAHPSRRRRLGRPVISVGNLSVGGTGKTPVVSALANFLAAEGERPSILSRGYARAHAVDGVVVASDGTRELASVDRTGDEPLMLARQAPGAVVCVSPDRHLAGALAERKLGCTVHLLDDGFQHLGLFRDLDILVTTLGEIPGGRVIPRGRLREPMDAAARAHVLVVPGATAAAASAEAWTLGISQSCGARRVLGAPVPLTQWARMLNADRAEGAPVAAIDRSEARVLAVAGIANPDRFVDALRADGWHVVETIMFADHHRYTLADVSRIERARRAAGAGVVFTTDKDAVRLETHVPLPFAAFRVPLALEFEPDDVLFAAVRSLLVRVRVEPRPLRDSL